MSPASNDQWARWRSAVTNGTRVEAERGDVPSGFYKLNAGPKRRATEGQSYGGKRTTLIAPEDQAVEAICIYRDDEGRLSCIRTYYGDGSKMHEDEIEDLFGSCGLYPISDDVFRAVAERGERWPPEYHTRLTMKDQAAGVAWTPEYGRKKLGLLEGGDVQSNGLSQSLPERLDQAPATGELAGAATEEMPSGHKLAGGQTPDKVFFAEVSALSAEVKRWLASIGGKPRDKAEADTIGDYGTKFGALEKKAETSRVAEKEPHLQAGREVDERWKRPKADAANSKTRCKAIVNEWMDAENARLKAEADRVNQEAAERAAAEGNDGWTEQRQPVVVEPERVTSVGNMRQVSQRETTVWVVTDPRAYMRSIVESNQDIPTDLVEALGKLAARRAVEAPGVEKKIERRAA